MKPVSTTVKQTMVEYDSITGDEHAFVSVTGWANGEGFDVELNETGCHAIFQLTLLQWIALKRTMKVHME